MITRRDWDFGYLRNKKARPRPTAPSRPRQGSVAGPAVRERGPGRRGSGADAARPGRRRPPELGCPPAGVRAGRGGRRGRGSPGCRTSRTAVGREESGPHPVRLRPIRGFPTPRGAWSGPARKRRRPIAGHRPRRAAAAFPHPRRAPVRRPGGRAVRAAPAPPGTADGPPGNPRGAYRNCFTARAFGPFRKCRRPPGRRVRRPLRVLPGDARFQSLVTSSTSLSSSRPGVFRLNLTMMNRKSA